MQGDRHIHYELERFKRKYKAQLKKIKAAQENAEKQDKLLEDLVMQHFEMQEAIVALQEAEDETVRKAQSTVRAHAETLRSTYQ